MESIPKRLMLVGFGMLLHEGDPEAIAREIVEDLSAALAEFVAVAAALEAAVTPE